MCEMNYEEILLIDAESSPRISEEEAKKLKPIQKQFIESYLANKDVMSVENWLDMEMKKSLPECSSAEVEKMSKEVITTLRLADEKRQELRDATNKGMSKESWFATEIKRATSAASTQEASRYLQNLDRAIESANEALHRTITTEAGVISQNPNLDGFIAEQYHAQTFNMNAEAAGSPYRAKVLEPTGNGYAKNSVDIVIVDEGGKTVRRYQSKYCKDAASTAEAFEQGDYRGQQKLVPEGQGSEQVKKATEKLEAPDGTVSNSLTKDKAKTMQEEAQSGKWNDLNWNEYKAKDLAKGIGVKAGQAALMGAAVGAGVNIAKKVWNDETIDGEEVVEDALKSGADFGVKAALSGALKVGAEKGLVTVIPKGTPAGIIANIVHVGIENAKILGKVVNGEYTLKEGKEQMEQVTVSTVAGISASAKGAAIGAAIGTVLGPVGTAVGGFVGSTVGYMAGSAFGTAVVKAGQKVREKVKESLKEVKDFAVSAVSNIKNGLRCLLHW